MRRRFGLFLLGVVLFLAVLATSGAVAYFQGWWIPNYPSHADYPVRGIDVSHHQGKIDWPAVAKDDVHFTYIKATEGATQFDQRFIENWEATKKAGIPRGAYHFFRFGTPGKAQAENFIKVVPRGGELPPAVDLEYEGNASVRPSPAEFQKEVQAFVDRIKAHYGTEPIYYTSGQFQKDYMKGFPIDAQWTRDIFGKPAPGWEVWQFSEKGKVDGIQGFVDLNVWNQRRWWAR